MKAMILAAGRGERLQPLTVHTPKALAMVKGKPIIEHHIEKLKQSGITEIVINVHYMKEKIMQTLASWENCGVNIVYSEEPHLLDTGGGVKNALPILGKDPFLLINADIFSDIDYLKLAQHKLKALAHLILVPTPAWKNKHDLTLVGEKVDFANKQFTFSGIAKISPLLFANVQEDKFSIAKLYMHYASLKKITGEVYAGSWQDIGTATTLKLVNNAN